MKGFLRCPKRRKGHRRTGLAHTGDLGTVVEQGNFKVTGRIKE
jgi:long-subunit acyl-CoA synthetase (AMP-forming)